MFSFRKKKIVNSISKETFWKYSVCLEITVYRDDTKTFFEICRVFHTRDLKVARDIVSDLKNRKFDVYGYSDDNTISIESKHFELTKEWPEGMKEILFDAWIEPYEENHE